MCGANVKHCVEINVEIYPVAVIPMMGSAGIAKDWEFNKIIICCRGGFY
jgi:hypothetical protein